MAKKRKTRLDSVRALVRRRRVLEQELGKLGKAVANLEQQSQRMNKRLLAMQRSSATREIAKLDYPHGDLYLGVTSRFELRKRTRAHAKEPWTVEWIERRLERGQVLYDIGANVGAYSLIAANHSGGEAQVFAFEPGYANYAALCDNIALNDYGSSITPFPVVLGDASGLTELTYSDVSAGAASHSLGTGQANGDGYRQRILTYRLDELIERFGLPWPNHLKIDVDGAESAVLEGARETLARPELASVLIEVDQAQWDRVVELLEAGGLTQHERFDERHGRAPEAAWYGVFVRR